MIEATIRKARRTVPYPIYEPVRRAEYRADRPTDF